MTGVSSQIYVLVPSKLHSEYTATQSFISSYLSQAFNKGSTFSTDNL